MQLKKFNSLEQEQEPSAYNKYIYLRQKKQRKTRFFFDLRHRFFNDIKKLRERKNKYYKTRGSFFVVEIYNEYNKRLDRRIIFLVSRFKQSISNSIINR